MVTNSTAYVLAGLLSFSLGITTRDPIPNKPTPVTISITNPINQALKPTVTTDMGWVQAETPKSQDTTEERMEALEDCNNELAIDLGNMSKRLAEVEKRLKELESKQTPAPQASTKPSPTPTASPPEKQAPTPAPTATKPVVENPQYAPGVYGIDGGNYIQLPDGTLTWGNQEVRGRFIENFSSGRVRFVMNPSPVRVRVLSSQPTTSSTYSRTVTGPFGTRHVEVYRNCPNGQCPLP